MARLKKERISHSERMSNKKIVELPILTLKEYVEGYPSKSNAAEELGISHQLLSAHLKSTTRFFVVELMCGLPLLVNARKK